MWVPVPAKGRPRIVWQILLPLTLAALLHSAFGLAEEFPEPVSTKVFQSCDISVPTDDGCFFPPLNTLESVIEESSTFTEESFWSDAGANFPERPIWSSTATKLVDPREYRRITDLDNDDPSSFVYTQRPNLFNIPVPDEWDWINLINTDRPDFTDTPFSVGKGVGFLESGITNTRVNSGGSRSQLRSLPEALLRVGLSNDFELRMKWLGYQMANVEDTTTGLSASTFGGSDLDLGFKWVMFRQKNWFPMSTLVAGALLPTGTNGLSGNSVQPHFNFVQGWALRRYAFLKHQFGLDYLTQPSFSVDQPAGGAGPMLAINRPTVNSYHSSISLLYQTTKRVGGFFEWFVLYGSNQPTMHFADTGIFFYLTPTIQLDGVIGTSLETNDGNTLFTKAGFSTRW